MSYEIQFLIALAFTIIAETTVLLFVMRKKHSGLHTLLLAGCAASFATLPYVWFIFPFFIRTHYPYLIASEAFALLAETLLYAALLRIPLKKGFIVSLCCNTASFVSGELLKTLITF